MSKTLTHVEISLKEFLLISNETKKYEILQTKKSYRRKKLNKIEKLIIQSESFLH